MHSLGSESTVQDRLDYLSLVCANPSDGLSAGLWCEAANEGLMLARSLFEQLEAAQAALRQIAERDSVDEWITGEECAEIARAALGELARASTQAEVEGSHPSGCRCLACLMGETGNAEAGEAVQRAASIPATESVLERKAREQRESPRGAPPSVHPDPDIDLRGASSPASGPLIPRSDALSRRPDSGRGVAGRESANGRGRGVSPVY